MIGKNIEIVLTKQNKTELLEEDTCSGCIFLDSIKDCVSDKFGSSHVGCSSTLVFKLKTKTIPMTNREAIQFIIDNPNYFFKVDNRTIHKGSALWIENGEPWDWSVDNIEYKETIDSTEYKKLTKEV